MKSPFPGMDPYLEQFWPDVHASLIIYTRDQLEEQLPANLIARVEERVVFETETDEHHCHGSVDQNLDGTGVQLLRDDVDIGRASCT